MGDAPITGKLYSHLILEKLLTTATPHWAQLTSKPELRGPETVTYTLMSVTRGLLSLLTDEKRSRAATESHTSTGFLKPDSLI